MLRPWSLDADWIETGKTYYDVEPGMDGWQDYVDTVNAFYHNSFFVPCVAGYALLGAFVACVIIATLRRMILLISPARGRANISQSDKVINAVHKHILSAPLFGQRHAETFAWSRFFPWQAPLRGQTLLLLGLFLANFIPLVGFYRPSPAEKNLYWPADLYGQMVRYVADRAGVIATVQMIPLILMSGRNNPVCLLTGASYNTAMLYHRWFARFVMTQTLVHGIAYTASALHSGKEAYDESWEPYWAWGVAATFFFAFLCFFSLRYFRRAAYEIFVCTHVVFAVLGLVCLWYHVAVLKVDTWREFLQYLEAAFAFWAFDRVVRIAKLVLLSFSASAKSSSAVVEAVAAPLPGEATGGGGGAEVVKVTIQLPGPLASQVKTGSHVYLWIPRLQLFSAHPFTVAKSTFKADQGSTLVVLAKANRGLTKKLYKSAGKQLSVFVEGPYGGHEDLSRFDRTLLFSSGIGITHCLSIFTDAIVKGDKESHLIWTMRDPSMAAAAIELLEEAVKEAAPTSSTPKTTMSIFVTRSSSPQTKEDIQTAAAIAPILTSSSNRQREISSDSPEEDEKKSLGSSGADDSAQESTLRKRYDALEESSKGSLRVTWIHLPNKRPVLEDIVAEFVGDKKADDNFSRTTAVVSCGANSFCDDVRQASRRFNLHLSEEPFEW